MAMPVLVAKNLTGQHIFLTTVSLPDGGAGRCIPASGQVNLVQYNKYSDLMLNQEMIDLIGQDKIILISDGETLSKQQSLDAITSRSKLLSYVYVQLDGYEPEANLDERVTNIQDSLDGYSGGGSADTTDLDEAIQSIRKDLDGYAILAIENQRWVDSSQQRQGIRNALDGYNDGSAISGLDQTVTEHYKHHSQAIQTILQGLDGYASDQTVLEHYNQHSSAIQSVLKDLDGYALSTIEDQRWADSSQQRQDIRVAIDGYASSGEFQSIVNTELEHTIESSEVFQTILKDLDGYALLTTENQRWVDSSQQRQDIRDAADGYAISTDLLGLSTTVEEHKLAHSADVKAILDVLDGYDESADLAGLVTTVEEHKTAHGTDIKAIADIIDGYALLSIENQRWANSSQQRQDMRNVLDGYALGTDLFGLNTTVTEHSKQHSGDIKAILDVLDGYDGGTDISGLTVTVEEHKIAHSTDIKAIIDALDGYGAAGQSDDNAEAIQIIRKDLDGYALLTAENQRWVDSSQQIQELRSAIDGYALLSAEDQRWSDSSQQRQGLRNAADGYALDTDLSGLITTVEEHKLAHSTDIKAILDVLDGYDESADLSGLTTTVEEHKLAHSGDMQAIMDVIDGYAILSTEDQRWTDSSQQRQDIRNVLDGYSGGGGGDPASDIVESAGDITTTSTSDVLATSMTLTPASGTYMVWFTGSLEQSDNSDSVWTSIYSAGTQVSASERNFKRGGSQAAICASFSCVARVTVNGSQDIEGMWRVSAGTGTMHQRTLSIIKVSA